VTIVDKIEHGILGALVSVGLYGAYKYLKRESLTVQGVLGSLVLGGLAGVLPDLLEPATNPNHRSCFHSLVLLSMLAYGNKKVWDSQNLTEDQKLVFSLFSAAFGSHLTCDSSTPKSIPLLV
jgi:membrane-bound metal-dependent hydrolase YbcI (DUF457 family)